MHRWVTRRSWDPTFALPHRAGHWQSQQQHAANSRLQVLPGPRRPTAWRGFRSSGIGCDCQRHHCRDPATTKTGCDFTSRTEAHRSQPDEIFAMDTTARIDLLKGQHSSLHARLTKCRSDWNSIARAIHEQSHTAAQRRHRSRSRRSQVVCATGWQWCDGYVASTGQSYLCHDASQDPLYLKDSKALAVR